LVRIEHVCHKVAIIWLVELDSADITVFWARHCLSMVGMSITCRPKAKLKPVILIKVVRNQGLLDGLELKKDL
jgi:hypothetical protein